MFEWALVILIMHDMKGNKEEESNEENSERKIIEEMIEKIIEEESKDKNPLEGFLISNESDRKKPTLIHMRNLSDQHKRQKK